MAEYIELEAAVDAVTDVYYNTPDINLTADKLEVVLRRIHAADVAPVVHGRWVGKPLCGNETCKCSVCGSWHNIHANLRGEISQKYCPNCGARMDLEAL